MALCWGNPKAPNPYVTWQFNEQDGTGTSFGATITTSRIWQNGIFTIGLRTISGAIYFGESRPRTGNLQILLTQRPIDIGTYPNSYFNRPVHMDLYLSPA